MKRGAACVSVAAVKHAVYAGSFDPITNGHLWIIQEACRLFDKLTVAIGDNPDKSYTFSQETRLQLIQESIPKASAVEVSHFDNRYLVDYASEIGAQYVVRGIRSPGDYEYERVMRQINEDLRPEITTVFLMPPRHIAEVSSSMVRGLVGPDGWQEHVRQYVPEPVFQAMLSQGG